MILEGIVTSVSLEKQLNIAPMGAVVDAAMDRLILRPFRTSQTFRNLKAVGEGVFHVVDDVLLLAKAAIGRVEPCPDLQPACRIAGFVLQEACRYYEFRVLRLNDRDERATIEVKVVHAGSLRDFFGFNRAKHAVVEAAILATRVHLLPPEQTQAEFRKHATVVDKTGGPQERQAFKILCDFLASHTQDEGTETRDGTGSRLPLAPRPSLFSPDLSLLASGKEMPVYRVRAPSRLHFGLLKAASFPTAQPDWAGRHYGGVGLMIQSPGTLLRAIPAESWSTAGPQAARSLEFLQRFLASLPPEKVQATVPRRLIVEQLAPEHMGLGTGTQLALAVSRAAALACDLGDMDAVELARRVGRGTRSALGIHGFTQGGFLVDGGKRGQEIAPLVARVPFPEDWPIVLVLPRCGCGLHGEAEDRAFDQLAPQNNEQTDVLCRLVLLGLLPALVARDFQTFSEALHEFNARAGEAFAAVQGGTYSSPQVAEVIASIRSQGIAGVGQSSWGPAVFAITPDQQRADALMQRIQHHFGKANVEVLCTRAFNSGQ